MKKIIYLMAFLAIKTIFSSYKDFENYLYFERFPRAVAYTKSFSHTRQAQRFTRYLEVVLRKAALHQLALSYYKLHEHFVLDILTLEEFYYVTYGMWPHLHNVPKSMINKTEVIDDYHELFMALERDLDQHYNQGQMYTKSVERALSFLDPDLQQFYRFHKDNPDGAILARSVERIALKILAKWPSDQWFSFSKADIYYILTGKIPIADQTYKKYAFETLSLNYQLYRRELKAKVLDCKKNHQH